MATEQSLICITAPAAADLSAKQFYLVKIDSSGNAALCSATTDEPIGVLQNTPTTNQPASIAIAGVTKCVTGSALAINVSVSSDSAGKGTSITLAAGGTTYNGRIGLVKTASAAAGGVAEVILRPGLVLV